MKYSLSNLKYQLVSGHISLEPMQILDSRILDWEGYRVTFFVLGASHAVRLEWEGQFLTELLTCSPTEAENFGGTEIWRADTEQSFSLERLGWRCSVQLLPFELSAENKIQGKFPPQNTLSFHYPLQPTGEIPRTEIGWKTEDTLLTVETLHTYPEEGRGVHSLSRFERVLG